MHNLYDRDLMQHLATPEGFRAFDRETSAVKTQKFTFSKINEN